MKKLMGLCVALLLVAGLGGWGIQSAFAGGSHAPAATTPDARSAVRSDAPAPRRLVYASQANAASDPYGRMIPTRCSIRLVSGKKLRAGQQAVVRMSVKANSKKQPRAKVVVRKKRGKRYVGTPSHQQRFYPGHPKTFHFGAITVPGRYTYTMKLTTGPKSKFRNCSAKFSFRVVARKKRPHHPHATDPDTGTTTGPGTPGLPDTGYRHPHQR
jgi:hypothetical protein